MKIIYNCILTIETKENPQTEAEWEAFNIKIENEIESNLESTNFIDSAEMIMEEKDN